MRRIVSRTSIALLVCAFFVCVFCAFSLPTIWKQSATADEAPLLASSYLATFDADFRLIKEDPPLLKYFVGMTMSKDSLRPRDINGQMGLSGGVMFGQAVAAKNLFGVDWMQVESLIKRGRLAMFSFGLLLGIVVICWTWVLAGSRAAMIASILFAFEPTLLGNSPLVKGDVLISLIFLGIMITTWLVYQRVTLLRVVSLGLLLGLALATKCTGVLLLPVPLIALGVRALSKRDWGTFGSTLKTRRLRLACVAGIGVLCAGLIVGVIWTVYQFRFSSTPDPAAVDPFPTTIAYTAVQERLYARQHNPAALADGPWRPGLFVLGAIFLHDHRLLPEPWISGLLDQRAAAFTWPSYLLGQVYKGGCWYYFPLAIAVKEPLAIVLILIGAAGSLLRAWVWRKWWFLVFPIVWYGAFAITSPIDVGIRHLLPVFSFAIIGCAIALDSVLQKMSRGKGIVLTSALFVLLAGEVGWAFPHYIAFFNIAGRAADPLYLLGDSNLDWGQDLPLLASWQREHPHEELYLHYFGPGQPSAYGIVFHDLANHPLPAHPGTIAISATNLQGIYLSPQEREKYQVLWHIAPSEILGGTIYIFDWNGKRQSRQEDRAG